MRGALSHCEELGYNYKLVRGLASVLEGHCVFEARARFDPVDARRAVFDVVGDRVIATEEEQKRALTVAAYKLGVSSSELKEGLYADLWDEQVLAEFDEPDSGELLKGYNFALTLALLARARRIELGYSRRDVNLEERGEMLGVTSVHRSGGASKMTIELRPSNRVSHSNKLVGLVSELIFHDSWSLSAEFGQPSDMKKDLLELRWEEDGKLIKPKKLEQREERTKKAAPKERQLGEIVVIEELAFRLGVTEAEARQRLNQLGGRYVELSGVFIAPAKLRELEGALASLPDMRLSTVQGALRRLGCRKPLPVLEALGYTIEWDRDREKSRVYKIGRG